MPVLVTGAAGFIGYCVATALLARGDAVIGVDNLNEYYDVRLKQARLKRLREAPGFRFQQLDIAATRGLAARAAAQPGIHCSAHLAAQAGVRHSPNQPQDHVDANITGHLAVLELARRL